MQSEYTDAASKGSSSGQFDLKPEEAQQLVKELEQLRSEMHTRVQPIHTTRENLRWGFCKDPASTGFCERVDEAFDAMLKANKSMADYTDWLRQNLSDAIAKHQQNDAAIADAVKGHNQ